MKNNSILTAAVILGVLMCILTGIILFNMPSMPKIPKCPDCKCPEPVVINNTETIVQEVEVEPDFKQKVVEALLSEVSKDKDFRECDEERFKTEEISVKRVYSGFTLEENSDGDLSISDVQIKLNYDNGECYRTFVCGLDIENELVCED